MADQPTYYFTAQDQLIAGGNSAGSVQGNYVTPYGLLPNTFPNAKPDGTPLPLDTSKSQEPWRARRFHEDFGFAWQDLKDVPDSVATIGDLCKYLRELDPIAYPLTIYGDKQVKMADGQAAPGTHNIAQAMFDHWSNSKFRYETVKSGFDWNIYAKTPGDIKIKAGEEKIKTAVRSILVASGTPGGPGGQSKSLDDDLARAQDLTDRLKAHTANIRNLQDLSERAMRDRFQVVNRLNALKTICDASAANPKGMASGASDISSKIAQVAPKVHDMLVKKPIRFGTSTQQLLETFNLRKEFTNDLAADLTANVAALHHLLLENDEHANNVFAWAKAVNDSFLGGQPAVMAVIDDLTTAFAEAHLALGEFADTGHDEVVKKLLDAMPTGTVKSSDIKGTNTTEVVVSWIGRGTGFAQVAVGNLAGPPSFAVALTQVYAARKLSKIASSLVAETGPAGALDIASFNAQLKDLTADILAQLTDKKLEGKIVAAIDERDQKALAALSNEYGEAMGGAVHSSTSWKCSMSVFGILSLIIAFNSFDPNATGATSVLQAMTFMTTATGVTLGTAESVLTVLGRFEPYAKIFTKLGNVVGIVGGILGTITGVIAYADAANKADSIEMLAQGTGVLGSVGITLVAVATLAGASVPVAGQIALGLLLVSAGIGIVKGMIQGDNLKSSAQVLCVALLKATRDDAWCKFCETNDASVGFALQDIDAAVNKTGTIGDCSNDYFTVMGLGRAGLSKEIIQKAVNSEALANTPFGPGPGPAIPQ